MEDGQRRGMKNEYLITNRDSGQCEARSCL